MKDKELKFDRTCHVLYTKPCKVGFRNIRDGIDFGYSCRNNEYIYSVKSGRKINE